MIGSVGTNRCRNVVRYAAVGELPVPRGPREFCVFQGPINRLGMLHESPDGLAHGAVDLAGAHADGLRKLKVPFHVLTLSPSPERVCIVASAGRPGRPEQTGTSMVQVHPGRRNSARR